MCCGHTLQVGAVDVDVFTCGLVVELGTAVDVLVAVVPGVVVGSAVPGGGHPAAQRSTDTSSLA